MIKKKWRINGMKGVFATIAAYISAKLGLLVPVMLFLLICMVFDYATGLMAEKYEKLSNPDSNAGWSSRKGMIGIFKKVSYLLAVSVGIGLDWLILTTAEEFDMHMPVKVFFGILIALWYVLNEMLSIVENLNRMDAKVPIWLTKVVILLQNRIDDIGESQVEEREEEDV